VVNARDALAGYFAREAVMELLRAALLATPDAQGSTPLSALVANLSSAKILHLVTSVFNISEDQFTDPMLKTLRQILVNVLNIQKSADNQKADTLLRNAALKSAFELLVQTEGKCSANKKKV
jgi:hypothetical protein